MKHPARWGRLAAGLLLLAGCAGDPPPPSNGESAPPFQLTSLTGHPAGLPRPGAVVVLHFWADSCPFCESELRALAPVHERWQPRGLSVLAVNVGQDRATAQAFLDRLGIGYETLLDQEGVVARRYGVIGLPTTFVVGRDGRLAGRILGEATPATFEAMLAPLL